MSLKYEPSSEPVARRGKTREGEASEDKGTSVTRSGLRERVQATREYCNDYMIARTAAEQKRNILKVSSYLV